MEIPVYDRSNYLKGLLITARKDNQLSEQEKKIIKGISERLGFASDFYDEVIHNLLANKYIKEDVLKFSKEKIAESFIIDALKVAFSDASLPVPELTWLRNVAVANNISSEWFEEQSAKVKNSPFTAKLTEFALYSII
jgi:tellurite resistance protein